MDGQSHPSIDRPTSCEDGVLGGASDLYFEYYSLDALLFTSDVAESCPGEWPDTPLYFDHGIFRLVFWNENLTGDESLGEFCWRSEVDDRCTFVPNEVLHEGGFADSTIDVSFTPCGGEDSPCPN